MKMPTSYFNLLNISHNTRINLERMGIDEYSKTKKS